MKIVYSFCGVIVAVTLAVVIWKLQPGKTGNILAVTRNKTVASESTKQELVLGETAGDPTALLAEIKKADANYETYTVSDLHTSIHLPRLSLEVNIRILTGKKPLSMTSADFAIHEKEGTRELIQKIRDPLVTSLGTKCEVTDDAPQKMVVIVFVEGYDVIEKTCDGVSPAILVFDTNTKRVIWHTNAINPCSEVNQDAAATCVVANVRKVFRLDQ